jgi:diguanylate cyclase (GGDEF)-like protein
MGLLYLAWAVAYTCAAVVGGLTRPDDSPIALVWPAAGVAVLWVLYTRDGRRVVSALLLGILATVVNSATGAGMPDAVALGVANMVHAVVTVLVLERRTQRRGMSNVRLSGTGDLFRLGSAAVAGATMSMPFGLLVWSPATDANLALTAGAWVLRYSVVTAVVVAVALAWRGRPREEVWSVHSYRTAEIVAAAVVTVAAYAVVFGAAPGQPYAFLVLPLTVWVAVRVGPFATSVLGLLAGATGVVSALADTGPFGAIDHPLEQSMVVQSFVAVVGIVGLGLSLAVEERRQALRRAGEAREALQQTLDGALVGQAVVSLADADDGRILYANSALRRWYGNETLVGRSWLDLVGSADRRTAEDVLEALAAGRLSWHGELEHQTRDGVRFCEVAAAQLPPTGGLTVGALRHASVQLLDVSVRREFAARLSHQALHDELTGLPNRALFHDRLDHALASARRSGRTVAVIFLDLDHFKTVNDSLGHAAGDEVIRTVAERLASAVRPSDTVARVGGDEFVVCCPEVGGPQRGAEIAARLLQTVNEPILLDGRSITISTSAGIAIAGEHDSAGDLLRESDTAMYAAKSRGRGRLEFFEDALYQQARRRLAITNDARAGLTRGEFVLHYQPVVSLMVPGADWGAAEVLAVEALVRWQHPERGLLPPGEWLDIVETSDMMNDLGTWVLRTAAAEVAAVDGLGLHVNVSATQLRHAMVDTVAAALDDSGLCADRLVLELTETQLVDVHRDMLRDLYALRELGVALSVDDFGTHYSSLTQLTTLPVSELKVDKSFVMAMDVDQRARAIVQGVLGMAGAMGLGVVAEGVETPAAAAELRRWGCPTAQGYLWGRPQPWHELRQRFHVHRSRLGLGPVSALE